MNNDKCKNVRKRKDSDEATLHSCAVNLCTVWNETISSERKRTIV